MVPPAAGTQTVKPPLEASSLGLTQASFLSGGSLSTSTLSYTLSNSLRLQVIKLGTQLFNPTGLRGFDLKPCGVQRWPQWVAPKWIPSRPQNHFNKLPPKPSATLSQSVHDSTHLPLERCNMVLLLSICHSCFGCYNFISQSPAD